MSFFDDYFDNDIRNHAMTVIRDDGVYRHLRFARPGTMCMHFDILTWPGYLCYTGDMGTYVFKRLYDMFEFFRRPGDAGTANAVNLPYWAEKLESADRQDGVRNWSEGRFREDVTDWFGSCTDDADEWPVERKEAVWSEIEEQVIGAASDSEHHAMVALHEFDVDGFRFDDFGRDCKEWSHRFVWCCHALPWAIDVYDASKTGVA